MVLLAALYKGVDLPAVCGVGISQCVGLSSYIELPGEEASESISKRKIDPD